MPRSETIKVNERNYTICYADDPLERREAVTFFQSNAACLFPKLEVPPDVEQMSIEDANDFFMAHPIQEQWSLLRINPNSRITDCDLAKLQFLPELEIVCINANISDVGVRRLLSLPVLKTLVLYSDRVTDGCLEYIRQMRSLRMVDFQGSPGVSPGAFREAINSMSPIPESWPPSE